MRTYMFDVLQASFPHAETILQADKAAAAGRDEYDDAYFDLLYRDTRPILEQRLSAAISAVASAIVGAWEAGGKPVLPLDPPREIRKVTKTGFDGPRRAHAVRPYRMTFIRVRSAGTSMFDRTNGVLAGPGDADVVGAGRQDQQQRSRARGWCGPAWAGSRRSW